MSKPFQAACLSVYVSILTIGQRCLPQEKLDEIKTRKRVEKLNEELQEKTAVMESHMKWLQTELESHRASKTPDILRVSHYIVVYAHALS